MTTPTRYIVFGGGCYGSFYVGQLLKGAARGALNLDRIEVLDHDPDCRVAREHGDDPRVQIVVGDWHDYGHTLFSMSSTEGVHWVPAPLAPHAVFHWLREMLAGEHVRFDEVPGLAEPPALEFAAVLASGSLALSHAPGQCPMHCIEPVRCPLTRDARDWQMRDTVADRWAAALDALEIVECVHHAWGVGTIEVTALQAAARRLTRLRAASTTPLHVGIATVSACHGIVDVMRLTPHR